MTDKFLDSTGLRTLLLQLTNFFATKANLIKVKELTDPFIIDIDYSLLEFDTGLIVSGGGASSPIIGQGTINSMIIAKS